MKKLRGKKSCAQLETEAYLLADSAIVGFCCSEFDKATTPVVNVDNNYNTFPGSFKQFRDDLIFNLQNETSDSPCTKCKEFKEGFYYKNRKLRRLGHSNGGGCNFQCIYCTNSAKHPVDLKNPDLINFSNFLSAFEQSGELTDKFHVLLGAGEFTIHPERSALYELGDYAEYILTNGSIYDQRVDEILANGNAALEISLDAGTRQTFSKIKGFDLFDKVIENTARYAQSKKASVHLKYIFLPGINDNAEDVEGFVNICADNKADFAVISYDLNLKLSDVSDETLKMIKLMIKGLDERGILYADYSGLSKTERYKNLDQ